MHTLLDLPTTLKGELALKWFEFTQTGLPMTLAAGVFGGVRLNSFWQFQGSNNGDFADYVKNYVPWAIKAGSHADFLLAVEWEKMFEKDLDELREEYRIIPFKN